MSFFVESITEFLLQGVLDTAEDPKVPKLVRYAILTVTYLLLSAFLIYNGVLVEHTLLKSLFWILLVVVTVYFFYLLREIKRSRT